MWVLSCFFDLQILTTNSRDGIPRFFQYLPFLIRTGNLCGLRSLRSLVFQTMDKSKQINISPQKVVLISGVGGLCGCVRVLNCSIFNPIHQVYILLVILDDSSSENYTCMYMTLNIKRHINLFIRHIIYSKRLSVIKRHINFLIRHIIYWKSLSVI